MTDFKSILVPIDGSPLSERTLSGAMALAQKFRSEVILVYVLNVPVSPLPTLHPRIDRGWMQVALTCAYRRAQTYLDVQRQEVCRQGIEVRTLMCDRSPAEAIVALAASEKVDLIVMNGQGRDGLARWDMSTVADMVVQESPCPVLLMDSGAPGGS